MVSVEVLCISNGHGEDEIGVHIALALQHRGYSIVALPLVGEGYAYRNAGIALMEGVVQAMPTGGFIRMDWGAFWRDIRGGLLGLTWQQLRATWQWSTPQRLILAVGDIVPLLFGWMASFRQTPYIFVATAKSEYYWRDRIGKLPQVAEPWGGSVFYGWERWLMSQPRCKATFVRDALTAQWLQKRCGGAIYFLGNPMMDGIAPSGLLRVVPMDRWVVTLLPGSRPPEAYANFRQLVTLAEALGQALTWQMVVLVAVASGLDREVLVQELLPRGWKLCGTQDSVLTLEREAASLLLVHQGFGDCLDRCHFGLAMAGTATEQLVGSGKPVFTLGGEGPQFTRAFAEAQVRLLGSSVILLQNPHDPTPVLDKIRLDPDFFQQALRNGQERMGLPGASDRIADFIVQRMSAPAPSTPH